MGHHVLQGDLNASVKNAQLFNVLWRGASCPCCRKRRGEEYQPSGSLYPAIAVVSRRKGERKLQENAVGEAKAMGKRDPSASDAQRRAICKTLLLRTTTAMELHNHTLLRSMWVLRCALESRGATARDLTRSDLAIRIFDGMFASGGRDLDALCA